VVFLRVHALYLSADNLYPISSLSVVSYDSSSAHVRLIPECAVSIVTSPLGSHLSCIVLGTLRTTMT